MDEQWFGELREMSESVRPTGGALRCVQGRIRRRRRLRALGATVAAAGLVGTVVVVGGSPWERTGPDTAPPIASGTPTPTEAALFDCPLQSRVFGQAPAISDLARQERIIELVNQRGWKNFEVRRAEPTHLGVVALVSGDLDAAVRALPEAGVQHVYAWDPTAASVGVDAAGQVQQVLQWLLGPAVRDVRRAYRGIAGYQSLALWRNAGAVLLQWEAPVPEEIMALAGVRPDGVRVVVEPTRYSARDIHTAATKVVDAIRDGRVDAEWSMAHGCGDGSGLVVGIEPASLGDRRAVLQKQLAEVAGMPVRVVPEDKPVERPAGEASQRRLLG